MTAHSHMKALTAVSDNGLRSLADMHERIGDMAINNSHYYRDDRRIAVGGSPLRELQVEDQIRPINPNLYNPTPASAKYAADWNETDTLHDAAWQRYTMHKDKGSYKREVAEINGREFQEAKR